MFEPAAELTPPSSPAPRAVLRSAAKTWTTRTLDARTPHRAREKRKKPLRSRSDEINACDVVSQMMRARSGRLATTLAATTRLRCSSSISGTGTYEAVLPNYELPDDAKNR